MWIATCHGDYKSVVLMALMVWLLDVCVQEEINCLIGVPPPSLTITTKSRLPVCTEVNRSVPFCQPGPLVSELL